MKRFWILLLCVSLLLVGCNNNGTSDTAKWERKQVTSDAKPYAQRAIAVIDQYLNFEIDKETAREAFDNITQRMGDSVHDLWSPEHIVYSSVQALYLYSESFSDSDFRRYRDILAFQIGEDVSGVAHDVDVSNWYEFSPEDSVLAEEFDIYSIPAANVSIRTEDDGFKLGYVFSITFDVCNGVYPDNFKEYVDRIKATATEKDIPLEGICIDYFCYEQPVFGLNLWFLLDDPSTDATSGISLVAVPDYSRIASFNSIDQYPDAIKTATAYLGTYAP